MLQALQAGRQRLLVTGAPGRACLSTCRILGREEAPSGDKRPEKAPVWGVNIPSSPRQLKEAGQELAENIGKNVRAAADAAAHKLGLKSDDVASSPARMGAAGKMQHAPPGSTTGGPAASAEHVRAKYDEISSTEKPNFPEGEASVNRQFPDMAEAARLQNLPEGQAQSEATRQAMQDLQGGRPMTPAQELNENLHEKGP